MLSSRRSSPAYFCCIKIQKEMKAAVIYKKGEFPEYTNFAEPAAPNPGELLVRVKAVAIKHFDKGRATGRHYSSDTPAASGRVVGGDGVFLLDDGTRVFGMGVSGTLAERAVIYKDLVVPVPAGVSDAAAAALPNAVIGAAMGLRFKAGIKPGDVVFVNGATGFTGQVAVQIAKHYGASKVIATGRNQESLDELLSLGADEVVRLGQDDESFKSAFTKIHAETPVDIIIDYLWGHTAEMILACLKGNGSFTHKTTFVSVGAMAGDLIQLSAENLRSVDLQLTGSGMGAWPRQQIGLLFSEILPEMFQLAEAGRLTLKTQTVKIADIASLWNTEVAGGERLVVTV
jgi:NADPH:quinone reductase-like Zn-dependent oxidoreductase